MDMKMLIGGQFVDASDGKTQENRNPATGELIGTVPAATKEDIDRAVANAVKGQKEWSRVPLYRRIEIFDKFRELLAANRRKVAEMMCREGGKLIGDALGEVDITGYVFRVFGEGARNHYGLTLTQGIEPRIEKDIVFTRNEPLGVVACIVPFNFPAELYAHKVAPALITGNAVIVKSASDTPMADIMFTELLVQAGVPGNAAQIVTGSGAKIGDWLTQDPRVDAISLTGSTEVGAHIMATAAKHVPHVYLELGGNDPLIVCEDCGDLDAAVQDSLDGRVYNAGQTCCASKRFLVHNSLLDAYTKKLVKALTGLRVGDPSKPETQMGPVISERAAKDVIGQVEATVAAGAKCLLGGKRNGAFVEPTVLAGVTRAMPVAGQLEIFGPVFPVIGFDTVEEAIEIANGSPYGLHAGVRTASMKTAMKFATELQCGCVVIGGSGNYRSAHQAFGGYKQTGVGREGVGYTLNEFTQTKTVALRSILD